MHGTERAESFSSYSKPYFLKLPALLHDNLDVSKIRKILIVQLAAIFRVSKNENAHKYWIYFFHRGSKRYPSTRKTLSEKHLFVFVHCIRNLKGLKRKRMQLLTTFLNQNLFLQNHLFTCLIFSNRSFDFFFF